MVPKKTYEIFKFNLPETPGVAAFHPKYNYLVSIDFEGNGTFRVFNFYSGEQLYSLEGMGSQESLVIFGSQVISGSGGGQLFLWDLEEAIFVAQIGTHGPYVTVSAMDISNDGPSIVSGDKNGVVRLWDFGDGPSGVLGRHSEHVDCTAISPDGRVAISAGLDGKIRIWDCLNFNQIRSLDIGNRTLGLDISHSGEYFINFGTDVSKRNLKTGKAVWSLDRMPYWIGSFSIDDDFILCGGPYTLSLLDSETGEDIISFEGQTGRVIAIGFSSDGQQVYSAANDGSVRIWRLPI
jgi:WD40 repeat protein